MTKDEPQKKELNTFTLGFIGVMYLIVFWAMTMLLDWVLSCVHKLFALLGLLIWVLMFCVLWESTKWP